MKSPKLLYNLPKCPICGKTTSLERANIATKLRCKDCKQTFSWWWY